MMLSFANNMEAQFWQGFMQGIMQGVQRLPQQIQQQQLARQRQEEARKRQEAERKRQEEERKRQEEERKRQEEKSLASNSSTNSDNQELRYKGIYTISSQGREQSTGGYTGVAGPDFETEIEIYDDYITVSGTKCRFSRISKGERVYNATGLSYGNFSNQDSYYVDGNYNIRKVSSLSGPYGVNFFEYNVAKGKCTMPKYQPQFSGDSSYGGVSDNSFQSKSTHDQSPNTSVQRKCPYCKNGRILHESSVPSYGVTPYKKKCQECGFEYMSTTSHSHTLCGHCGGSGYIKY